MTYEGTSKSLQDVFKVRLNELMEPADPRAAGSVMRGTT